MKQRIITAAVLIAIFLPVLLYGGIAFEIATFFLVGVATYEVLHLFKTDWSLAEKLPVYFLFILGNIIGLFKMDYFIIINSVLLMYVLTLVVFDEKVKFEQAGIVFMVFNLVVLTVASLHDMYSYGSLLVIYMLVGTFMTDSFALFCGKAFGKHKLNERISPKKTIEGSVGGYIISAIICLIYGFVLLKELPVSFIVASALTIPFVGQIGDLAFSAIKRAFNVKDYGNIFPGHGGVLDRIDSVTFNALLMYCLMIVLL